jgi:hypothetical protein
VVGKNMGPTVRDLLELWEEHYRNIVVRKPSKDICGVCYQFHLTIGRRSQKN